MFRALALPWRHASAQGERHRTPAVSLLTSDRRGDRAGDRRGEAPSDQGRRTIERRGTIEPG
jgi:hypothetical protein